MNLVNLMTKLKRIDENTEMAPVVTDAPQGGAGASDESVEECGGVMIGGPAMGGQSKQQDSVTMNVSMNGSGANGIKDLMNILKNIEQGGAEHGHDDVVFGEPGDEHDEPLMGAEKDFEEEAFGNSVHGHDGSHTAGIDAVTGTGDDMFSKGREAEKVNGGGNPFNVDESLVRRLSAMYEEVKTRQLNENVHLDETGATLKHILNTYKRDVLDFEQHGDMSDSLYDALYDYYFDDMPYGVKKARDGDPYEWVADRFASDLGISETIEMNKAAGAGAGD